MSTKKRIVYPIQLDAELDAKISLAAERLDMTKADVMRLAMRLGLENFRRLNYRLAEKLSDFPEPEPILKVADDPAPFIITKRIDLPYYGTVAAGRPGGPLDVMDGTHPAMDNYDPLTHYVLRVNGQSMEPDYLDGSFIICRKLKSGEYATKGDDVIACDASGAYFKRLIYTKDGKKGNSPRKATPHLVSINPDFPEVVPVGDCPISAVVVGRA